MRAIQFEIPSVGRCLGVVQGEQVFNLTTRNPELTSVVQAFHRAQGRGQRLGEFLQGLLDEGPIDTPLTYGELLTAGRVMVPVSEEHGTRLLVSGTGLTHLGSVQQRDAMHQTQAAPKSDSRKMFELGLAGGQPPTGQRGAAPEWFYKGDGRILRGPGQPLEIPPFAPNGGEEPEVVSLYIINARGTPCRLGFARGNEWSDHATESTNYLYLAPSKLRVCAIGPELVPDLAFDDIRGRCRVRRDGAVLYDSGELLTGTLNMCHSLANLEDHHFKFPQHRFPGDLHVHFFGTSKLTFQHRDWQYQTGDEVEIAFEGLGAPPRNPVIRQPPDDRPIEVIGA